MPLITTALLLSTTLSLPYHDPRPGHDPHGKEHHSHVDRDEWKLPTPPITPVYVGEGKHRYRWDSQWLQLPEGQDWLGATHGCIVVDSHDRVYMSAETGNTMLVYSPEGKLEHSFGKEWGAGVHGLTVVHESYKETLASGEVKSMRREVLYLAHTGRKEIYKTTLKGEVLQTIKAPPVSTGLYDKPGQYNPTSVAIAPDGTIFIADGYGKSYIHRYQADGTYLDTFGGRGKAEHHLSTPHGLWMDDSTSPATLLVADRENHRLARFSLEGKFLGGTDKTSGLFRRPCHVQFTGDVGVVSDLAGRTTLINRKLELIVHLGDNPDASQRAKFGIIPNLWRDGIFFAPHCARFNSKGELYVMDWNVAGRLTRLVPEPQRSK